jgi:hypothetical protein
MLLLRSACAYGREGEVKVHAHANNANNVNNITSCVTRLSRSNISKRVVCVTLLPV